MDWLLERTVGTGTNGACHLICTRFRSGFRWWRCSVALLAELLELLVPALETKASKATSLKLKVNWQKTKVQALGSREDEPSTITVQGQEVAAVKEFVYVDNQIRKSRIFISTKVMLYNTCILPRFLWVVGSYHRDVLKMDAFNQWCLWKLLGIKRYHHVRNDEVRWTTKQPHLSTIVQARRFTLREWQTKLIPRRS